MRKLLIAAAVLTATACGEADRASYTEREETVTVTGSRMPDRGLAGFAGEVDAVMAQDYRAAPLPPPPAAPAPPPAPGQPQQAPDPLLQSATLLAYSYGATLELPAAKVREVMTAHEETCRAAGPATCQLLSANVSESGPDYIYAYLTLRAEPTWLATFREGLEGDAENAEGRVTGLTTSAEDLTTAIVDTDAFLRTQRMLRQRLESLLATQQGDLSELVAVERELARVQGEIDSAASRLEVMRRRVQMSTLNLSYASKPVALSENAFTPLASAFNEFFYVLAQSAGGVVAFVAAGLPWLVIAIPVVLLVRGWWRSRRKAAAGG